MGNPAPRGVDRPRQPIDGLCANFALSGFERDVLLLCAGIGLDATLGAAVARRAAWVTALHAVGPAHPAGAAPRIDRLRARPSSHDAARGRIVPPEVHLARPADVAIEVRPE